MYYGNDNHVMYRNPITDQGEIFLTVHRTSHSVITLEDQAIIIAHILNSLSTPDGRIIVPKVQ